MKYVFICAVGRSGSTLLLGLVNAIPGFHVRGENWGLAATLYEASTQVQRTRAMTGAAPAAPTHPWYGAQAYSEDGFAQDVRTLMLNQLQPPTDARATGFKEIRWSGPGAANVNLWSYLRFLDRVFPEARFLFLTRKVEEIVQSGWWTATDPIWARDTIETFYLLMRHAPLSRVFQIDYADLAPGGERLMAMYDFLGETYDACAVKAVLDTRHGLAADRSRPR